MGLSEGILRLRLFLILRLTGCPVFFLTTLQSDFSPIPRSLEVVFERSFRRCQSCEVWQRVMATVRVTWFYACVCPFTRHHYTHTLKMASTKVDETSVAKSSPSQDSNHPENRFSIKVHYISSLKLCKVFPPCF